VPGHWKEIFLTGTNNSHIATLVERHTRFVVLLKIPRRDTATVVGALTKHVRKPPQQLRRSLTWDRGKEMVDHKSFTVATKFLRSTQPLQRGSNENTNGLLRQYFPRSRSWPLAKPPRCCNCRSRRSILSILKLDSSFDSRIALTRASFTPGVASILLPNQSAVMLWQTFRSTAIRLSAALAQSFRRLKARKQHAALPAGVNVEKIEASFVFAVTPPKKPAAQIKGSVQAAA
jgi:hypothetical protein